MSGEGLGPQMIYGKTLERHLINRAGGIIAIVARAIVALAAGDLGEAQHTLGRAMKALGDFQGDLSDEISQRRAADGD